MNTLDALRAGALAGAKRLDLSAGLTEFPREVFALADTLEVLNLSGNLLDSLPDDLHRLHRLKVLFCSDNRFTALPEAVGRCEQLEIVGFKANRIADVPAASLPPKLRWLILTDNAVETLPAELGARPRLQKLMLAGNRLRTLPDGMAACRRLELLRISANRFETLPDWLTRLPRLSWLAFAGNPFDEGPEADAMSAHPAGDVDWADLSLGPQLGEGASGVIHRADWRRADGRVEAVAVKLFKGAVTSDGWPHSEMAACIAAGAHPHLIAVLGRVRRHPAGTPGLVLSLVDRRFVNLAGPPSLQSCTRDVYPGNTRWSARVAHRMASGIASAVAQLHERGVIHGDLYAHNILWDRAGDAGDCVLGDFGAASFLPRTDAALSLALQRTEARAFGCLLEELLALCEPADDRNEDEGGVDAERQTRALLDAWRVRCMAAEPADRPAFADIARALAACDDGPDRAAPRDFGTGTGTGTDSDKAR